MFAFYDIIPAALRGNNSTKLSTSEKVVPTINFADDMATMNNDSPTSQADRLRVKEKLGDVEFDEELIDTNTSEAGGGGVGGGGGDVSPANGAAKSNKKGGSTDWRTEDNIYKIPSGSGSEDGTPRKSYSSKKNKKSGKSPEGTGNMNW